MIELGGYIRDIFKLNEDSKNFRIFGPDESMSNRLYKVFEAAEPRLERRAASDTTISWQEMAVSWMVC